MRAIKGDKEKVKAAVMLLMDRHWGKQRIATMRTRIQALPRYTRGFVGNAIPLNYLYCIVKDDSSNAVPVLNLLDQVEKEHTAFWEAQAKQNVARENALNARMRNVHAYRLRIKQAIYIDSCRAGHILNKDEQARSIAKWKEKWAEWANEFTANATSCNGRERLHNTAKHINDKMDKWYKDVLKNPEAANIRKPTQHVTVLASRIDKLEKKYAEKR